MLLFAATATLLAVEPLRDAVSGAATASSVLLYDNFEALATVAMAIAATALVALVIDTRAVLAMFLPAGRGKAGDGPRWGLFRALNWIASVCFLLSVSAVAVGSRDPLRVSLAFLSLAYLLSFFGVSLISREAALKDADVERLIAEAKRTPEPVAAAAGGGGRVPLASYVPLFYFAATVGGVLSLSEGAPLVRAAVAVAVAAVLATYARVGGLGTIMRAGAGVSALAAVHVEAAEPWAAALSVAVLGFAVVGARWVASGGQLRSRDFGRAVGDQRPLSDAQRAQRAASYPAPFPNGWYTACLADELAPGTLRGFTAVGQDLVVFRGESGEAGVLKAHCPHLGADLSAGGTVEGDCITCPFHKWRFRPDGSVASIPYSDSVPEFAKTHSYPVYEYYGLVVFWFHAEGEPPSYHPPRVAELDGGTYEYRGRYGGEVSMHIQEFAENSVDFQHFDPLHGSMLLPFTSWALPFLSVDHGVGWRVGTGDESHLSWFTNHAKLLFNWRGKAYEIPRADAHAEITMVGSCGITIFRFQTELGNIVLFETHLPLAPMKQKATFYWYAEKTMPRLLTWYVVGNWISQVAQDFMVWQNKIYLPKPMLVKGDGPVTKLRRHYAQFYTSSSRAQGQGDLSW